MIEDIYIDEAGNTGQDLLNADQGAFVLASNNFPMQDLQRLAALFPEGDELHFAKLKGSEKGRSALVEFLNHDLITEKNIQCIAAHKEFIAVTHIVDRLIEPVLYDRNIDIYQHGENIWMSNYIYYAGQSSWRHFSFDKFLTSFMSMVRRKTGESIENFYHHADQLLADVPTEDKWLLSLIVESKNQIDHILLQIDKFALDVTLSSFYVLCDRWYKKTGKKLRIYQDDSKQITHYRDHIDFTTNLNIETQSVGFDDRTMVYPTQIHELKMVSSATILGVQISDLIASSMAFMYNNKNTKHITFVEAIKNSRLLDLSNNFAIWPSTAEAFLSKNFSGKGQNPLDFLATQFLAGKK